jgi:integrase
MRTDTPSANTESPGDGQTSRGVSHGGMDSMTTSNGNDKRREVKVAPNLYRQGTSDHYRYSKMVDGVSVFQRFTASTLTEAKKIADELRTRKPSSFGDKSVTVEGLAASYLERESGPLAKASPRTVELRHTLLKHHVVPALGPKAKAVDIEAAHLRKMIDTLRLKGLAGSTIRGCVASASAVFRHGVKDLNALPRNPCRDLDKGDRPSGQRRTEPRYLSVDEVELLLGKLSDESRPIAAACYWAALRISEAMRLRWEHIDFDGNKIKVPGSKTEASKASVPLLPELSDELKAHRARLRTLGFDRIAPGALVFQTASGLSPGRRNVLRAITNAAKRAGLQPDGAQPVGAHDLRHSMAAYALEDRLSLAETSHLLRHVNVAVTASVYAGLTDKRVAEIGSKLTRRATA